MPEGFVSLPDWESASESASVLPSVPIFPRSQFVEELVDPEQLMKAAGFKLS